MPFQPNDFVRLRMDDWTLLHAELDWAYEGGVEPAYRKNYRQYPGQSVFLVRRGALLIRTPSGSVVGKAGEWILPPQKDRLQKFSDDAEIVSIHLQLHWPGGEPLFNWDVAVKFDVSVAPQLEVRSRRLARLVSQEFPDVRNSLQRQYGSLTVHCRLRYYFSAWLCTFMDTLLALGSIPTRLGPIDPRIFRAVQLLDRFALRSRFRQADFAREVGLSPTHLDRLFVHQFGLTPRRYLEKRKLEQATSRLRSANSSGLFKIIAFDLGFNSLAHFSGWFRHQTGVSPSQFRLLK
jgi:AraC-like DNA-binding protein